MTTTQAPTNGHLPQKGYPLPAKVYQQDELSPADEVALFAGDKASPPPFPVEHPAAPTGADLPTDKANISSNTFESQISDLPSPDGSPAFPACAYHVPPKLFAPQADSFRNTFPEGWSRTKLPDRCQFMFSDGRQCTMTRSDIHPSLCVYHSDREEQLFGDPGQRCEAITHDFPELHSACRDLSTARGVNRALAQVFRMLARGRISRQEAATFAKLGHLLLQSIRAARAESLNDHEQPISPILERQNGVPITPLLPHNEVVPSETGAPDAHRLCARWGGEQREPRDLSGPAALQQPEPALCHQTAPAAPPSTNLSMTEETGAAAPDSEEVHPIESNSRTISTCPNLASNSRKINTYEDAGLKGVQIQHLQNKRVP